MRGSLPASSGWCWSPGSTAAAAAGRSRSSRSAPSGAPPRDVGGRRPGRTPTGSGAVLELAGGADAVGVDCPIGLPARRLAAGRPAGEEAARARRPRGSSWRRRGPCSRRRRTQRRGPSPGTCWAAAASARRPTGCAGSSSPSTTVLRAGAAGADVVEVHPELSFMALAGRAPGDPLPSKKTDAGRAARLAALGGWAPDAAGRCPAPATTGWTRSPRPGRRGGSRPAPPEVLGGDPDEHGLPMRMVSTLAAISACASIIRACRRGDGESQSKTGPWVRVRLIS